MKRVMLILAFCCVLLSACTSSQIAQNTHPTQEEWLEIYLTHEIYEVTDLWNTSTVSNVAVVSSSKQIVITVTTPNSEMPLFNDAADGYKERITSIVETILEDYPWAKDYKLIVQII